MKAIMRRLEDSIVSGAELSAIFVWVKRKWDAGSSLEVMSGAGATAVRRKHRVFQQTQAISLCASTLCAKISSNGVIRSSSYLSRISVRRTAALVLEIDVEAAEGDPHAALAILAAVHGRTCSRSDRHRRRALSERSDVAAGGGAVGGRLEGALLCQHHRQHGVRVRRVAG
jgi:hypothetical protein